MNKKKVILIAGILLLAVAAYFLFFGKKKMPQTIVKTELVELGSISNSITATGKVEPVTEVEVGTQVSGKIDKIHVDYNSKVKKGQLLAELDRSTLSTSLESAKTDYSNAMHEYDYYKKVYDRNVALHEKKLISEAEFEEVEFQYMKVSNSLRKAKYEVDRAKTNLGYATITSPINGVHHEGHCRCQHRYYQHPDNHPSQFVEMIPERHAGSITHPSSLLPFLLLPSSPSPRSFLP